MGRLSQLVHRPPGMAPGTLLLLFLLCLAIPALGPAESPGAGPKCEPTPADIEGPFYRPGAPERDSTGEGLTVSGRLLGAPDCRPLAGGRVEWWHAGPSGDYDDVHRGRLTTNADGSYRYTTRFPGKYPGRALHIHVKAAAKGHRPLTTQLYLRGGETGVVFDIVLSPSR